ncbi:hypothetical protein ACFWUZ_34910 [Streptomyces sp. NPDC058646]|uniref:hypothetical protein n=1 Tax=Streptomyces sp. NPDC058646 TaxID=3346574 RepID=UPI0036557C9B
MSDDEVGGADLLGVLADAAVLGLDLVADDVGAPLVPNVRTVAPDVELTVSGNAAAINPGGIYHVAGTATLNTSSVTANTPTNRTGIPSPVPGCTG